MLVTYTGKHFDYNNVSKENVDIEDILRSLPRLNRFVGHSTRAYSVGEHSFYCALMAEKLGYSTRGQLLTFIHDFTEAYVSDCPAPLKRHLPKFEEIESRVELAICDYLGIEPPTEEEHRKVKRIDMTMLVVEMRDLTVHEWKNFIDEHTYTEILKDSDFNLNKNNMNEDIVRFMMKSTFELLMKKYKEEYGNGSQN